MRKAQVELETPLHTLAGAFSARRREPGAAAAGWIVVDPQDARTSRRLADLERWAAAEGARVVAGAWQDGLLRPYGGLLALADALATEVHAEEPALLARYGVALANLLPAWRAAAPLPRAPELRSGLAEFALRGDKVGLKDFYWRRDVSPWLTAELIHFVLDAAGALAARSGVPALLLLENVERADASTAEALRLLAAYASRAPVLLCATARELGEVQRARLVQGASPASAWQILEAGAEPGNADERERVNAGVAELARAASVLVLPFRAEDLSRLAGVPLKQGEERLPESVFRPVGRDRFALRSARLRDGLRRELDPARRRLLHERALAVEAQDPFAACWHAVAAGLADERPRRLRDALERAWGVSAFECALALAERLEPDAVEGVEIDLDVLRALLEYDAGHHREADRLLSLAVEKPHPHADRNRLRRLLGYNAAFGLGEFDRGREILRSVLAVYEELGRMEDAAFLRNNIAYTLFRGGRVEEAVEMERSALDLLAKSDRPGGLLQGLLQLNLGRLYRNLGLSAEALELFRATIEERRSEVSPYLLLIFHGSLAHLHAAGGEPAKTLLQYHHCFELARDLDLENAGYPVHGLLAHPTGPLLAGRATRGDELFFYLYLNLALTCRRLGQAERAAAYLEGMRSNWKFLDPEVWRQAEAALQACGATAPPAAPGWALELRQRAATLTGSGLVEDLAVDGGLAAGVARALAVGKSVAIVRPREIAPDLFVLDSLVLYDPRERQLARTINSEVGVASSFYPPAFGYGSGAARVALALPAALDSFAGDVAPVPLVMQETALAPAARAALPGLEPYRLRLQVLSAELDGFLLEVLQEFALRTGLGLLAAVPFHLRRRPLATSAEKALDSFLVSPIDHLVLGDRLLARRHGAAAEESVLPLLPRLSRQASIVAGGAGTDDSFLVVVRAWPYHGGLRLRNEVRPLLDLCDGRHSVEEVARRLEPAVMESLDWRRQVCGLLRKLSSHGAICFDAPSRSL